MPCDKNMLNWKQAMPCDKKTCFTGNKQCHVIKKNILYWKQAMPCDEKTC